MEFLKRNWTQVQTYLSELTGSQKWLIAALTVILLMVGGLLMVYAGGAERVAVSQFAGARAEQVMNRLRTAGIDASLDNGQVSVPAGEQDNAIMMLAQGDLLSEDAAAAFNELVPSPWETDAQGRRKFLIAKQQVLGSILGKMKGVRSADVIISMPEDQGFGTTHQQPSASATLTMSGSQRIDEEMINAVAGLVAGAVAEMSVTNVTVIDANLGRSYTVDSPDEMIPSDQVDLVRQKEDRQKKKIEQYLSIPGAVVAVHLQQQAVQEEVREETSYMETEPLQRTRTQEIERRDITNSGEPGPRSNTGATIAGGGGEGMYETIEEEEQEFGTKLPTVRSQKTIAGHSTEQINVTINVPRQYFVSIYQARNPAAEGRPDAAVLQPVIDEQLADIEGKIQPLVEIGEAQGVVKASMFFDNTFLQPQTAGVDGGFGQLVDGGWVQPATIGALCLLALGLMVMMVRKATEDEPLPSIEELAGIPNGVPDDDDAFGDAEEIDNSIAGVEMTDDEVRSRRVAEQIGEMIKASPEEAGSLLGKWVDKED